MDFPSSSLPALVVHSTSALVLAAAVAGPGAHPTRAHQITPVQTVAIYVARVAPPAGEAVYDSAAAVCRVLRGGATGVHYRTAALPSGTPVAVLQVDQAACADRTVPIARVRVSRPGSRLDGATGYVVRGGLDAVSPDD